MITFLFVLAVVLILGVLIAPIFIDVAVCALIIAGLVKLITKLVKSKKKK